MKVGTLVIVILLTASLHVESQDVGIGTTTPGARLEIKGEGSNSLTNTFILRNSTDDILLRMRNDGRMSFSYNGSTFGRTLSIGGPGINLYKDDDIFSGAIFPTDTSMVIWSQSEENNYVILQPSWGKVGIGTYSPKAKFHLRMGSAGSVQVSDATMIVESSSDAVLNLLSPISHHSALYFGYATSPFHGGILYNEASVPNGLSFRTSGSSTTKMVIAGNGEVGIGTLDPIARLDVNGSLNVASEYRRTSTGSANIVPICFGSVSPGPPPVIESGTGNFTVGHPAVGVYEITITSENYLNSGYTTVVTPVSSNFRAVSTGNSGNNLIIKIFNSLFDPIDSYFHFVVYQN